MTHLPFARKYRPQAFNELVGQPHVTTTLTRAVESKRLAQAYLFAGLRGVGKTSAARILAKCLNCVKGPTATPCHQCPSCAQITAGASLDVLEIDGASNRGIDEVRSLRETVPFAPASGPFRIYIIDEVHMLTTEAFNALLKTLEEPPAHVKFIFATTAPNKVPATVLSRCQRFDFRRIDAPAIVAALQRVATAERIQAEESALYAIARASDGSLRDAEVVLEQLASFVRGAIREADVTELLGTIESDALFALAQAILERDAPAALTTLMGQLEQGKDAPQFLTALLQHVRNLLIMSSTAQSPSREAIIARLVEESPERLKRLEQQAPHASTQELLLILQILGGAYDLVRRSPLAQTILELAVIKLATREQWQSLEELSRRLEQLGARRSDATAAQLAAPSATPPPRGPRDVSEDALPPRMPAPEPLSTTAPPAASMSSPEGLLEQWPVFLERLSTQKMSLAAYLADARPVRLDGALLTIGLPGFALHQEVLTVLENRRLIERLLGELCHTAITVQYATLPEPAEAPADADAAQSSAPPIVQDIVKLFNATLLDQPPQVVG